jgi:Holliday junction resolvasome RuvABC endonuclease subunit
MGVPVSVLGVDWGTRGIDMVLLADDGPKAEWVHFPCGESARKRGAFFAARYLAHELPGPAAVFWERHSVWLVGIEDPMSMGKTQAKALGLIAGAVASCLPMGMPVVQTRPTEWKKLTVGNPHASKESVRAWGLEQGFGWEGQTQDAMDAYAIARAVRSLNEKAVAA